MAKTSTRCSSQGFTRAWHQLKDFVAKRVGFENRIAEYREVFEKRKRRKPPFAGQKTIMDDTPWALTLHDST